MRPLSLLLFAALSLAAQPVSFGLKGGVPLTDFIDTVSGNPTFSAIEHPKRYIVGPEFEIRLPFGLGIEVDALYRRVDYQVVPTTGAAIGSSLVTSNDWEFPVLLKYRFRAKGPVRPYLDAGISFDRLQGLSESITTEAIKTNSGAVGGVVGGGLDIHLLVLHITPEIRYTRWTSQHFNLPNVLSSNQNQAEFLVGVTF